MVIAYSIGRRGKLASLTESFAPSDTSLDGMSDAEKIDEILVNQRKTLAFISAVVKAMGAHPMMRAIMQQNGIEV
jgi:hypothetical protein